MRYLARKVNRVKWSGDQEGPSVDGITNDLRTVQNCVSMWRCQSIDQRDLSQAVLALASGAERVDQMDIVWLSEASMQVPELDLKSTPGDTPIQRLRGDHVDVFMCGMQALGKVATLVSAALADTPGCVAQHRRWSKTEISALLIGAVECGELQLVDLSESSREHVATTLLAQAIKTIKSASSASEVELVVRAKIDIARTALETFATPTNAPKGKGLAKQIEEAERALKLKSTA